MPSLIKAKVRDYDTAIAPSPVRHAIFNRPFTQLVKKTEVLLDQITGATLPPDVAQEERERKERDRALTCRGCKSTYGDEKGLRAHHSLFPSHINPPRKAKPPRRSHRSHSTSDALSQVSTDRTGRMTPSSGHGRSKTEEVESERPAMYSSASAYTVGGLYPSAEISGADDFKKRFAPLNDEGDIPLPPIPARHMARIEDHEADLLPHARRNYEAGKASAARSPLVGLGPTSSSPSPLAPRAFARSASDSAINVLQSAAANSNHDQPRKDNAASRPHLPASSPSVGNVFRAVIATAAAGPSSPAVSASKSPDSPLFSARLSPSHNWLPLSEDEATAATAPPPSKSASSITTSTGRTRKGSLSALKTLTTTPLAPISTSSSVTFGATPGSGPVTGLTSFSDQEAGKGASPQHRRAASSSVSLPRSPVIRRKNTNPFLYQQFDNDAVDAIAAMPASSTASPPSPQAFYSTRTPPLDPSTPRTPLSPKNPFARMLDDDFYDVDEEGRDAPEEGPRTPGNTFGHSPSKNRPTLTSTAFPAPPPRDTAHASIVAASPPTTHRDGAQSAQTVPTSPHFDAFLAANEEQLNLRNSKYHDGTISQEQYLSSFF